jgi:hypothetical protein
MLDPMAWNFVGLLGFASLALLGAASLVAILAYNRPTRRR